jgi:hypothetical protein
LICARIEVEDGFVLIATRNWDRNIRQMVLRCGPEGQAIVCSLFDFAFLEESVGRTSPFFPESGVEK